MSAVHAIPHLDNPTKPVRSAFRISFVTSTIAPTGMPEFPYMASQLNHDSIEFTAIIKAGDLEEAIREIHSHWPEATPLFTEVGKDFKFESYSMLLSPMGMLPPPPPPPKKTFWGRVKFVLFGTDPF